VIMLVAVVSISVATTWSMSMWVAVSSTVSMGVHMVMAVIRVVTVGSAIRMGMHMNVCQDSTKYNEPYLLRNYIII